jgi:hypothetical protein
MKLQFKLILIFLLLITAYTISAQTPGFNYQALILNSSQIQIPGTDVQPAEIPLGLEDIIVRFTITNEIGIEYSEEHTLTTDENGMISVIVGEGTPTNKMFYNIIWDGKIKYLNVELDILNNNEGFVFLDSQKILYIPHPSNNNSSAEQKQIVIIAREGQLQFTTPLPITHQDKIKVFRNGALIEFTPINATTIELEIEAICFKNDRIRIVQLY